MRHSYQAHQTNHTLKKKATTQTTTNSILQTGTFSFRAVQYIETKHEFKSVNKQTIKEKRKYILKRNYFKGYTFSFTGTLINFQINIF